MTEFTILTFEPALRPKSTWQKDDCLFCERAATLEAVLGGQGFCSQIRCCDNERCITQAKDLCKMHREKFGKRNQE